MHDEYVFVPYNTKPTRGKPYFAIGGVHWSAQGARNFMGDSAEWRRLSRQGWKIVKCKLAISPRKRTNQ